MGTRVNPTLVVFDVDGTLTDTAAVDEECFATAFREEFGVDAVDTDWSRYSEFTDSTIIAEIFHELYGRGPTGNEIERFVARFVAILEGERDVTPERFAPIPGARSLVSRLLSESGWRIALATGGWGRSARLKLRCAGVDFGAAPLASADDSRIRAEIAETAIGRAGGRGAFARVVLVGDTIWDVRTAKRLALPFLGVARGARAEALRAAGTAAVVPDFADAAATLVALATVPAPGEGGSER